MSESNATQWREAAERARLELERLEADPEYQAKKAAKQEELERKREIAKQQAWRDRVASAVPLRVARNLGEALEQTPAVKAIDSWLLGGRSTDIVLRGGVGTGKSTAAAYAVKRLVEPPTPDLLEGNFYIPHQPFTCCWLRPDALVSAIMHAYDDKAPKLAPYVVIDDLGRETRSEFVEAFCDLLDREGHTLIITTNLNREEMRKRYDLRVLDRLKERAIAFDIPGESMRKGKGDFR